MLEDGFVRVLVMHGEPLQSHKSIVISLRSGCLVQLTKKSSQFMTDRFGAQEKHLRRNPAIICTDMDTC